MRSPRLLALIALPFCASCVFLEVPEDRSLEESTKRIVWLKSANNESIGSFDELCSGLATQPAPSDSDACLVDFLHISDAQVRDETVVSEFGKSQLWFWDLFINVSLRLSRVQLLDSFVLASFLGAWSQTEHAGAQHSFVVHTGDLLDTSVVTELVETMNIFHEQRVRGGPLYSVAGNHDGLIFGNVPDGWSKTWGLGINRAEFVLGHHLGGLPGDAFGFERNELLPVARRRYPPGVLVPIGRALDRIRQLDVLGADDLFQVQTLPVTFRDVIHIGGEEQDELDEAGVQLGYYSVELPVTPQGPEPSRPMGIRLVMLDTRASDGAEGYVGLVQLGWLYKELISAQRARQLVLLFGHHSLDEIRGPKYNGETALKRLLRLAPHVGAYCYGHSHWNSRRHELGDRALLTVETGSLADFPQIGARLRLLQSADGKCCLSWSHFRPATRTDNAAGVVTRALLEMSLSSSRQEHNGRYFYGRGRKILTALFCRDPGAPNSYVGDVTTWYEQNTVPWTEPVTCAFADEYLDAVQVFGAALAKDIKEKRRELGFRPMLLPTTQP